MATGNDKVKVRDALHNGIKRLANVYMNRFELSLSRNDNNASIGYFALYKSCLVAGNRLMGKVSIIELNGDLILKDYYMKLKLFPISANRFFVEDIEKYLNIELDKKEFASKLSYDNFDK